MLIPLRSGFSRLDLLYLKTEPMQVVLRHLDRDSGDGDDTETVRAKFVVGADGAHSWVRKSLGISMDGEQTGAPYVTRAPFARF
jgi:2-polyprenyl-6-methoxyphenol hydroxylase-like FAD-dependent oxidoreductase